jgi:ABC-2 type transport system ATP-binding protein/lipopolysaccharide transport system ATP-binding protein
VVVQALNEIDLELTTGDRLALIGHNGAGKSTILRTMAGIYQPTHGRVTVEGKVAPLLDIWSGMDYNASGYENIELRGLCLGMSRREIRRKFDEIADFAELGQFLSLPIRTYSAGMITRLALSISTAIEADVLLIDESVGAGDAAFLEKAATRIQGAIERSGLLVFSCHADNLARAFCNKAVLLEHGRAVFQGSVDETLQTYYRRQAEQRGDPAQSHAGGEVSVL